MEDVVDKRIEEILKSQTPIKAYNRYWEDEYHYLYSSIGSYEDLTEILNSTDTNTLIFTMDKIVPLVGALLDNQQRKSLKSLLETYLTDNRMCEISPTCSQADEEDTTTVADAAEYALKKIEEYLDVIK